MGAFEIWALVVMFAWLVIITIAVIGGEPKEVLLSPRPDEIIRHAIASVEAKQMIRIKLVGDSYCASFYYKDIILHEAVQMIIDHLDLRYQSGETTPPKLVKQAKKAKKEAK